MMEGGFNWSTQHGGHGLGLETARSCTIRQNDFLNTRLLLALLLIGFAFVGGGVWHYLPWSKGPIAHAFPLGVGVGLLAATVVYFV